MRYQLSYFRRFVVRGGIEPPLQEWKSWVLTHIRTDLEAVWTGLEPATPCVTGRYSNQLNYHTNFFKNSLPFRKRVQRYMVFLKPPNVFGIFFRKRWKKRFLGWFFFFLCSGERCFFIFLLPEQKKNETKRKFAVCIFLPTPALFSATEKELAALKQLFLFNAPKSTYASRQKKEAGPWCFLGREGDNIASLVGVDVFA